MAQTKAARPTLVSAGFFDWAVGLINTAGDFVKSIAEPIVNCACDSLPGCKAITGAVSLVLKDISGAICAPRASLTDDAGSFYYNAFINNEAGIRMKLPFTPQLVRNFISLVVSLTQLKTEQIML